MSFRLPISLILLGILTACAASPQSSSSSNPPDSVALNTNLTPQPDSTPPDLSRSATATFTSDNIAPPPGALYTILCRTFDSPTHAAEAAQLKQILIEKTGDKNWYCIHAEDESDLYYGYYQTYDDRSQSKEFNRAHADRDKIAALLDENGNPLFSAVIFQPISLPDPPAPKEWDLHNNHGFWTLLIATYKDNPQRKQAAVDCVKQLRAQGWEAYYQHNPDTSDVFVGSWSRSAIREQDKTAAASDDPNANIVVLSAPPRGNQDPSKILGPDGRPSQVFIPKLDVQDPTLTAAMRAWPYTLVNGQAMGIRHVHGSQVSPVVPYPSYIIQVPHDEDQVGISDQINDQAPTAAPKDPMIPSQPNTAPPPDPNTMQPPQP